MFVKREYTYKASGKVGKGTEPGNVALYEVVSFQDIPLGLELLYSVLSSPCCQIKVYWRLQVGEGVL